MKGFTDLVLCDYKNGDDEVHVRASLTYGRLEISGQDFGPIVESIWGDDEYEYWYNFNREETGKLLRALKAEDDPKEALLKNFGGEDGCCRLDAFCDKHGIEYEFFSYA